MQHRRSHACRHIVADFVAARLPAPALRPSGARAAQRHQVRPQTPASTRDLGLGILSHYCGPELIDRVLAQHGRAEQRCRLLPARLVVNAILLMCLKPTVSYQKLMYRLDGAVPASQIVDGTQPLRLRPGS